MLEQCKLFLFLLENNVFLLYNYVSSYKRRNEYEDN